MRVGLLLLAVAGVLQSAPAAAQRDVVDTQLDSAIVLMRSEGFAPATDPWFGWLNQGGAKDLSVQLTGGTSYFVIGVCDNGCSDLDLILNDAGGTEVQADRAADDVPMLMLEGSQGGAYTIRVSMATCGQSTCRWGVRLFSR